MENGFILPTEKEIFIDQLKDIVDKAEDMLSEEIEGERPGASRDTPLQCSSSGGVGDEVRTSVSNKQFCLCPHSDLILNLTKCFFIYLLNVFYRV